MKYKTDLRFTSFDGIEIAYHIFADHKNTDQDVILLHGMGGDSNAYLFLAEEILRTYPNARCIACDLRGHGNSSRKFPNGSNSMVEVFAQDLAMLCQHLNTQQPIMIGHCLGGAIIQEYLSQNPVITPKLGVLICSSSWFPKASLIPSFWYWMLKKYSPHSRHLGRRSRQVHLYFRYSWDFDPFRIVADASTMGFVQFFLMHLSFFGWKNKQLNSLNSTNTVIMYGAEDQVIRKHRLDKMRAVLDKAQFHKLNSNHGAIINNPQQINEFLRTYYDGFFRN